MNRIDLVNIGWTCYTGYFFEILNIECWKPVDIDNCLFGIRFSKSFLFIDIFFFTITIFDKNPLNNLP